jgi:hypothetical protein
MDQVKPWQVVVVVAALVAVAVSLYFTLSGPKLNLASSVPMVDVNTGEFFRVKVGKGGATFPGSHPKTGKVTLLPVIEQDGKWFLAQRYMSSLKDIEGDHAAIVDAKTGEVRVKM